MAFNWLHSTYAKIIIGSIIGFLGISFGIYAGFAFTGNKVKKQMVPTSKSVSISDRPMKISPGDSFPNEFCYDSDGKSFSFDELFKGRNTILIFSLWGCGPCTDLINDYSQKMIHHLRPETQIIFLEDKNKPDIQQENIEEAVGLNLVFVDMKHWETTYDLTIWPTIIGIDTGGIIQHVQFGYAKEIDQPLAEYFFVD